MVMDETRSPRSLVYAALLLLSTLLAQGCASVPEEVVTLHQREGEIIASMRQTHLALIDQYVSKRTEAFEAFYFHSYGSDYLKNWKAAFKQVEGRDYEELRDFPRLYNDLVAEYLNRVEPLTAIKRDLRRAVNAEYDNVDRAHTAVGEWIKSVARLESAKRVNANEVLKAAGSELTVEGIEKKIKDGVDKLQAELIPTKN
jgi:hypothetical protein